MREIRQRVRSQFSSAPAAAPSHADAPQEEELQSLLEQLDIDVPRQLSTHRKFIGPFYLRLRRWVYREVRLAVEPIIQRQNQVNRSLAHVVLRQEEQLQALTQRIEQLEARFQERE